MPASSMTILALWQLRQTWRLLGVVSAGLLAAVVLVCAIPLYAQVAESAGLRHTLEADPQSMYITVHATNSLFAMKELHAAELDITQELQNTLGSTVSSEPDLSVQIPTLKAVSGQYMRLLGTEMQDAGAHLLLKEGRLPMPSSDGVIEFALTPTGLSNLHLSVGQYLQAPYSIFDASNRESTQTITLRLVGVFTEAAQSALFWHGETFAPETFSHGLQTSQRLPVLVDNRALIASLSALSEIAIKQNNGGQFENPAETYWYYPFDFSRLDINHLDNLTNELKAALTTLEHNPQFFPYVVETTSEGPLAIFLDYSNRVTVLGLPLLCLAFLIGSLVLFFVVLITGLLVEGQEMTIVLLRSRGASARQIVGSLLWQSAGPGLLALVLGPFLAIALAQELASLTLQPADRAAIELLTANRLGVALGLIGQTLLVMGLALLAMALSAWHVMYKTLLGTRRARARSGEQPLWTRFNLDLVAAALALLGFLLSSYISSPGVIDVRTHVLILPITTLIELLFLLLGGLLLCLRFFPLLLHLGERLAARSRGAAPLLAVAQMARAPRQSLRMLLLLMLAVAFALFTLIFAQTQNQRLHDLTAYRVGGDLSGDIPIAQQNLSWEQLLNWYRSLHGVTSVTAGYTQKLTGGSGDGVPIDLRAVDASTYASTIYWTSQDDSQPLSALTNKLLAQRAEATRENVIPAIVDDAAARSLNLSQGQKFVLRDFHGPLYYRVVGIVHFIPTVYDSPSRVGPDASISHGGLLVDYQTTSVVALAINQETLSPTTIWLRTSSNPAALANVRHALLTGTNALDNPVDRRELDAVLSSDPLYAALNGILSIGAAVALLLGLLSNLLVSCLNARERRNNFAVLRALGSKPWQAASVLLWEQGIVYGTALALGGILGFAFAWLILPAFIFSPLAGVDTANAGEEAFYLVQSVPAVHEITPLWPIVLLLCALLAICALALLIMTCIVLRPSISQTLRVDED
ncbi:MAG TPA: ABC transporter permease [Ktedonobacteraceae bacterium]